MHAATQRGHDMADGQCQRCRMYGKAIEATGEFCRNWPHVYDNGGKTADRYTVIYQPRYVPGFGKVYEYLGMSGAPTHPQGFAQHGETLGHPPHLDPDDVRITLDDLPASCRVLVERELSA